jgi:hypothetical protein
MNGARAIHKLTGEQGPICGSATACALWLIFTQEHPSEWRIEPVAPPDMPAACADVFNPISLLINQRRGVA